MQGYGQQLVAMSEVKRSIPRQLFGRFELIEIRPDTWLQENDIPRAYPIA
jgi:hypothetical protein